ncbi:MAG: hypothetical protein Fur003_5980 [Candidatus Dojkabacteria bacterium]
MKRLLKQLENFYNISLDSKPQITLFNEGYMNNCYLINTPKQQLIMVIYNSNRYKTETDINRLEEIYSLNLNLPIRKPIGYNNSKHLMKYTRKSGISNFVGLYNYLEGETLPWEGYTRRHLFALGEMHKQLHLSLSTQPPTKYIESWDQYIKRDSAKLISYFIKNSLSIERKVKISLDILGLKALTESFSHYRLAAQLTHMDFVRGNILFSNIKHKEKYEITGILDFEKMLIAPVEFDIARTLAFLLVDCRFSSDEKIIEYYLKKGYGYQEKKNDRVIQKFLIYFWCRDLWKFLVSNPYESLADNFHYKATVERLIASGLLRKLA